MSQPPFREGTPRKRDASQTAICSGASFSIYMLRELIGAGSLANVYRAHDARLQREVAVKILNRGALPGADGLARFLHEARMAAAVRHPNVVSILDVGVHDDAPYIVMELLEGEDLDTRLSIARVLREPVLIDVALQLIGGLAAVHDTGVVHRDLRPSNVFLVRGAGGKVQPKLLDFSISKQTRDNLRLTTNGRRRWVAMPLYTAPEVLLDGDATFQSDQYSLGVLLYECVTGVNPFRADTTLESIELITTGQARSIREQPIRPSRRLGAIIEKAMHVYPERRFGDLHELGDALASLAQRRGFWSFGASPAVPLHAGPARPSARPRQAGSDRVESAPSGLRARRLGGALGVAVLGCSVAAPVWAWWSVHRQEQRAAAPVSVAAPLAPSEARPGGDAPSITQRPAAPALVEVTAPAPGRAADAPQAAVGVEPEATAATAAAEAADVIEAAEVTEAELTETAEAQAPTASQTSVVQAAAEVSAETASSPPLAEVGAASDGTPGADGPQSPPGATPEGVAADPASGAPSAASPAPDAGTLEGTDPAGAASPAAASSGRQERGTNGALIFD